MATMDMAWGETLEALTEGVVFHAASGEVETCNPAAERLLGLTLAQMRGVEALEPEWRAFQEDGSTFEPTSAPAMAALQTGRPQTSLIVGIDKPDGTLTWISLNAHPLVREGRPAAAITTLTDVTERRRAEHGLSMHQDRWQRDVVERKRAEEELRQRNRCREPFGRRLSPRRACRASHLSQLTGRFNWAPVGRMIRAL